MKKYNTSRKITRKNGKKNYEDGIFNGMSIMATALALVLGGAIIYNTLNVVGRFDKRVKNENKGSDLLTMLEGETVERV